MMNRKDVQITTIRQGHESIIRLMHMPTGIMVEGRSCGMAGYLEVILFAELEAKLIKLYPEHVKEMNPYEQA